MLNLMPSPIQSLVWLVIYIHMAMFPIQSIKINVVEPMSVVDNLKLKHEVLQGFVCVSPSDIQCIDDVCNENGKYWTIEVNGNYKDYNSESKLKLSDKVVLKYSSGIIHLTNP